MSAKEWRIQGDIIGSTISERDWYEMNTQGATSNPGSVQARIDRTLAKEAAEQNTEINRSVNCKSCNYKPELHYQHTETSILHSLSRIRKDGHTWQEDALEVEYLNMVFPG